ncbi:Transthyretin-like family protein [Ancylostoma ceylanicum]|uniref:Transthyretin-like family protein n=1 Tax=Ancylostoma ceylanicum TaxID=53326 RepID=A0A0D6MD34_9BILA|nr:Transthyretin-like family protein [Ancylostoma ceylanicum]
MIGCWTGIIYLTLLLPLIHATFREQSVAVKGIVNCRGVRQPGAFVQLYDEDAIPILDNDDLLGSVTADDRGIFCVRGATTEVTDIEPYIYIEHNCGYEGLDQKHYFIRAIPKEFITEGNFSKKTYHMGDIELLTKDAPVQHYQRRMLIHHHHSSHGPLSLHQQVMQCIPHYVAYKDYYEKVVVNGGTSQYNKTELEKQAWDDLLRKITGAPPSPPGISHTEDVHTHTETHTHVEDHRTHTEKEYRRELDHRREEHNRRLEEFKKLEEQRKQEIERLEQERKMWMEKLKELEEGQKKKHLVQIICSRDNVVRTTQIREYTEGEDPCEGFRRT